MNAQLSVKSKSTSKRSQLNRRSRRNGQALVFFALGIVVFVSAAALAVDMGSLYSRRAIAQKAADAAALAGAYQFATFQASPSTPAYAHSMAQYYAQLNGYTNGTGGATVTTTYPVPSLPANHFRVRVSRVEPLLFARIFKMRTVMVSASATALYTTLAPLSITGGGVYGQPNGPTSLSLFGPDGYYNNGDCYSVRTLIDGSPNPLFEQQADGEGQGYDFNVNIPSNFGKVAFEIFDPDCYNAGGVADALANVRVDELRQPNGSGGTSANATTTRYRLFYDNNTPANPNDDIVVDTKSYGNDSSTDMKWNAVFNFKRSDYGAGNFRLNVTSTDGSSENGFNLRVNKQGHTWNSTVDSSGNPTAANDANNGTAITANGHLPMNFNASGHTTIALGYVPVEAAGTKLNIRKFDTDVGGQTVVYTCDTLPGFTFNGVLSGNGQFTTDNVPIPSTYTGGNWSATYTAGAQDTSVWDMSYEGAGPGRPGRIRLVQ